MEEINIRFEWNYFYVWDKKNTDKVLFHKLKKLKTYSTIDRNFIKIYDYVWNIIVLLLEVDSIRNDYALTSRDKDEKIFIKANEIEKLFVYSIIFYSRYFLSTTQKLTLNISDFLLTKKEEKVHYKILKLRNKYFAHNEKDDLLWWDTLYIKDWNIGRKSVYKASLDLLEMKLFKECIKKVQNNLAEDKMLKLAKNIEKGFKLL